MLQTIIDTLQPDYLTIEMEPETQADNLPLDFSLDSVMNYVDYFLQGLMKNGVLIGAGSGTWDDLMFIDSIAKLPDIDFIDYHIYPINQNCFVDKVFKIDSIAKLYNKPLVIGESWLFKATDAELLDTTLTPADLFWRDVYSFWIPLDSLFFTSVLKLSHFSKTEITSLIWSNLFFAYIEHDSIYDTMWPGQVMSIAYAAAGPNILSNTLTPTGELYKILIADACDTTTNVDKYINTNNLISFNVYPNPANQNIFIESYVVQKGDFISIYNVQGKLIIQKPLQQRKTEIDISELSKGIYFIKVNSLNGYTTKKFIK